MQCKEWDDANSELFKESHDEAVHKNFYKSRLYELISASLVKGRGFFYSDFFHLCRIFKKDLTDICEAFLHGKEHTTWQAVRPALTLPLADICSLFSIFQCTEVKQPPFRPLPPAPWMGACRISEGTSPVLFLYG